MKILVINLTRMGDLLQSTPLLSELKRRNPDCQITLMANSKFASICEVMPFVDKVFKFDTEKIAHEIADGNKNLMEIFKELKEVVNILNTEGFSKVINLTHSKMSAFLTSLMQCEDKNGITVDTKGYRVIKNDWMVYFFNAAINRNFNPFNLVDMYLLAGGMDNPAKSLVTDINEKDKAVAADFYKSVNLKESDCLIGFQPGASKSHKQWPVENFAGLASILKRRKGTKIAVFGTSSESDLAKSIRDISGEDIIDVTGITTMQNLSAFIAKCSILITNDTGTMHVAAATQVPVIEISIGPVNFLETGPYGKGHTVIQTTVECAPCSFNISCKNPICKNTISPQEAAFVSQVILGDKKINDLQTENLFLNSNIFFSGFDDDGFLEFTSPNTTSFKKSHFWKEVYRVFWKSIYSKIPDNKRVTKNATSFLTKYRLPSDSSIIKDTINIMRVIEQIEKLSLEGEEKIKEIITSLTPGDIPRQSDISLQAKRITEIDKEIYILSASTEELLPICDIYRMKRESIDDTDVHTVSWKCLSLFRELRNNCLFMKRLLNEIIHSDFFSGSEDKPQIST